jgi:TonB family protein
MRIMALAVWLGISVVGMAQTAPVPVQVRPPVRMIQEDAPPPSGRLSGVLRGVTADTLTVSQDVLRGMAELEPDISARDEAPQPGVVVVRVLVSNTGKVEEAVAVAGQGELPAVAVAGVKSWKYRPYMVDGKPQEIQSTVTIMFRDGVGKRMNFSGAGVAGMSGIGGVAGMAGMTGGAASFVAPPGTARVSSGVVQGLAMSQPQPMYPPIAKAAHVQGVVVMHALISKTGDIENLQTISGPPMLVGAAMDAVRKWKYRPYVLNGVPTEVETTINVNFMMAETPKPPDADMSFLAGTPPPPAVPRTGDGPVFVSSGVMMQYVLASPQPACSAPVEPGAFGVVVLRAIISREGVVKDLQVVSAAKSLQECSLEAVRQWRYRPYLVDGVPKEVETMVVLSMVFSGPASPATDAK